MRRHSLNPGRTKVYCVANVVTAAIAAAKRKRSDSSNPTMTSAAVVDVGSTIP
jgi:hypothetical protein